MANSQGRTARYFPSTLPAATTLKELALGKLRWRIERNYLDLE